MTEQNTFLDDMLPALSEKMKGKMYFGGSEIYRINDFGKESISPNSGDMRGVAYVDVLWLGRPLGGEWFVSSRFSLKHCYDNRRATPAEIKLFEAAEKRKKEGKLESDAEMKGLLIEIMPERMAEGEKRR